MMTSDNSSSENGETNGGNLEDSTSTRRVVLVHGHNKWEWLFLLASISNCMILITISAIIIDKHKGTTILCISEHPGIVILAASCTALLFAVYGMWFEHQYDMYFHCVWSFMSLFFVWVYIRRADAYLEQKKIDQIFIGIAALSSSIWLFSAFVVYQATHAPDWIEFRLIGVSDSLADMYKNLCYYLVVLKSHSIFTVLLVFYSTDMAFPYMDSVYKFVFYGLIIVYALFAWILGKMAVKKEDAFLTNGLYGVFTCFILLNLAADIVWILNWANTCIRCDSKNDEDMFCYSTMFLALVFPMCTIYLMYHLRTVQKGYGNGLQSQSFLDLVSRNSNNLLSNERTDLVFT